jgi:hypothetical protein
MISSRADPLRMQQKRSSSICSSVALAHGNVTCASVRLPLLLLLCLIEAFESVLRQAPLVLVLLLHMNYDSSERFFREKHLNFLLCRVYFLLFD